MISVGKHMYQVCVYLPLILVDCKLQLHQSKAAVAKHMGQHQIKDDFERSLCHKSHLNNHHPWHVNFPPGKKRN